MFYCWNIEEFYKLQLHNQALYIQFLFLSIFIFLQKSIVISLYLLFIKFINCYLYCIISEFKVLYFLLPRFKLFGLHLIVMQIEINNLLILNHMIGVILNHMIGVIFSEIFFVYMFYVVFSLKLISHNKLMIPKKENIGISF